MLPSAAIKATYLRLIAVSACIHCRETDHVGANPYTLQRNTNEKKNFCISNSPDFENKKVVTKKTLIVTAKNSVVISSIHKNYF